MAAAEKATRGKRAPQITNSSVRRGQKLSVRPGICLGAATRLRACNVQRRHQRRRAEQGS